MNILKAFDAALVQEETAGGDLSAGYIPVGKTDPYNEYLSNLCWQNLLAKMDQKHKDRFGAGGGKELDEKDGKPPKMAAFASSSRMLYMLAKDVPGFAFEEKLTTTVGGMANLDGYLSLQDKHIFVEAKCREPYGHKAEQLIKQNYKDVYNYLRDQMPGVFSCVMEDVPEKKPEKTERNMRVAFFCRGRAVAYFDIKQMICHLLAVATKQLKNPDGKDIRFLYLLHDPTNMKLSPEAKSEIMNIYRDTCWAAANFDFKTMFGHIVDFLVQSKKFKATEAEIAALKRSFDFRLCSKTDFCNYLR